MAAKKKSVANARAREPHRFADVKEPALTEWVKAIADGQTQRGAAVPVFTKYGVHYKQLLSWCQSDPDGWGAALDVAQATKVETMEAVLRRIATAAPDDISEDPGSARARIAAATWLLSKWAPKEYAETKKHEHTGSDGGPIETKATVERYTLQVPHNPLLDEGGEE